MLLVSSGLGCRGQHRPPAADPGSSHPQAKVPPKVDERLVSANTAFGLKLLQKLVAEKPKENVFISPVSMSLALAMTYNGAAGETKKAMAQTMGVEALSLAELNAANAALTSGLQNPEDQMDLSIANSIWVDQAFPVKPEFLKVNQDSYGAQVANVDFGAPGTVKKINYWVSEKTNGKITGIVTPDALQQAALVLLDAAYFKAKWADPFKRSLTQDGPFTLADGTQKSVPLMCRRDWMAYMQGEGFQAVCLPYRSGGLEMLVFLPKTDTSLRAFCNGLTPEKWNNWVGGLGHGHTQGTLKLPRFRAEGEFDLSTALTSLGMGIAFERADLSGISVPGPISIGRIKHKTFFDVNEEGTEASAATAVPPPPSAPEQPFQMIVDRPFLCAICDNATGTILFLGAIVDPKA